MKACYIDTSVLVALCTHERCSEKVTQWYSNYKNELVSSIWGITEFASALSIKQRTNQLTSQQANQSWDQFQQLCHNDINLLPVDSAEYYIAANMLLDADTKLRAGDALHLACAQKYGAYSIATLDKIMAENAQKLKMRTVFNRIC